MLQGISQAVVRFPLTVFCLLSSTILTCYMISLSEPPGLLVQKLMFVFLFGAFVGVTAQFACERFQALAKRRLGVYVLATLFILAYYLIIAGAPAIDYAVGARTLVAVFSMFCAFIWLPSCRGSFDFNGVALVHFKSALTSILYAGVLAAGLAALIGAIDILFFAVSSKVYGYMMAIVWLLFATIYYLSCLPNFNSEAEADQTYAQEASQYPPILEILISRIAIPLLAAYTLVLLFYFVKIAVTRRWPIGQLGPMVLSYAAIGLLVYILASRLSNRWAVFYQRIFPKVLIPIVIMQLISVGIRLRAYGVTESRYYVALFGIFSLVVGIMLSRQPVTKNGTVALLAAGFAIFSVIPPVDAFTVSRVSQINRLEDMLQSAGILVDGQLMARPDAELAVRLETTNILQYLDQRNYLSQVAWLPADFKLYRDLQRVVGFEPTYKHRPAERHFYAYLDPQATLPVAGYDVLLQVSMHGQPSSSHDFTVGDAAYRLVLQRLSVQEVSVSVQDATGAELVSTGLQDFVTALVENEGQAREMLDADKLTLDVAGNRCQLRIVLRDIHVSADEAVDCEMFVLIAVPREG